MALLLPAIGSALRARIRVRHPFVAYASRPPSGSAVLGVAAANGGHIGPALRSCVTMVSADRTAAEPRAGGVQVLNFTGQRRGGSLLA
jgi:hypothetical protein